MNMQKYLWASDKIKQWHSRGKSFDECRKMLLSSAKNEGYAISEDEAITIIRDTESYTKKIIKDRRENLARKNTDTVAQYPNIDSSANPHWKKYVENLEKQGWDDSIIDSLDEHCSAIVDAVLNCNSENSNHQKRTKGLVIGHVQSGKTANMAGVMALCADHGFDAAFVLSGIHNKLNEQTTKRFQRDLWTYEQWAKRESLDRKGIDHLKNQNKSWTLLTKESDLLGDNAPSLISSARPFMGVFKKNIDVLKRFYSHLKKYNKNSIKDLKVLFIDDECDQASPNVSDLRKGESSAINSQLWDILELLPKSTYIGYTATPFANILNELPGEGSLYPSDFIYMLPKSKKYFGTKEFFGNEEEPEEDGLDIIRRVPEIDKETKYDYESLRNAIGYYICSSAARRFCRGYEGHMSMLVHVSHRIKDQDDVAEAVINILNNFRKKSDTAIKFLKVIWENEYKRVSRKDLVKYNEGDKEDYFETEHFDEIKDHLGTIIDDIIVRIDNSKKSEEVRLSYGDEPINVIAIGGNTLSRGLTLEGLNVSYFSRPGNQYDSLLQMGRWFGYRPGYEDLVRVWTTAKNEDNFRFLCMIEEDLRRQISDIYENSGTTPEEIALTVGSHHSMRIVRKDAMQEAQTVNTTFFSSAPQTIYFRRTDSSWLENNWKAGNRLLNHLGQDDLVSGDGWLGNSNKDRHVFRTGHEHIIEFFNRANAHNRHSDSLDSELISKFVQNAVNEGLLENWHVAVASRLKKSSGSINSLEDYKLIVRSRLNEKLESDDSVAAIKALRAVGDLFYDVNKDALPVQLQGLTDKNSPQKRKELFEKKGVNEKDIPGLLLLYPIDKDSEPKGSDKRQALNAESHVLGWSIVFPSIRPNSSLINRVGIPLNN